ncbi:MAG: hypothetical protein MJ252_05450 [archaeon]|nr:hypothetical protein [archaeon]
MEECNANSFYSEDSLEDLILNNKGNKKCFDCGKSNPTYASINIGIFLCSECSKLHKLFGKEISDIRSLYIDSWNKEQLHYLQSGGNSRLNLLLSLYNINKNKISRVIFYNSKIVEYHKQNIKAEVNNSSLPIMPNIEDGLSLSEGVDINLINKLLEEENKNISFPFKLMNGIFGKNKINYLEDKSSSKENLNDGNKFKSFISSCYSNVYSFFLYVFSMTLIGNKEKSI